VATETPNTHSDLLPVLVSDLVSDEALDFLWGVALANGVARIPLIAPPIDSTDHSLEVYSSGSEDPLLLVATPEGLPDEDGFPLRLRPAKKSKPRKTTTTQPDLKPKRKTESYISKHHSRDLLGAELEEVTSPDTLVGRVIAGGKLVIEELVGTGGVGAVYKARHSGLNLPVAVKVLHESFQHDVDFCKRFHAEALAASHLDHPNLTRVHDFGQEPDGLLYIAMDFLQGMSLRDILERDGRLAADRAVKIMMQVCAGLLHVHSRGLVHRDIKPDNVMLLAAMDDDGEPTEAVKVCDFGIAVGGTNENARIAGTPLYMAPEQIKKEAIDQRADIYACGIMLYEMMTGTTPFEGDTDVEIMRAHLVDAPPRPSKHVKGIPAMLETVILKSIAKEPAQRHQEVRELRRELRAVLEAPRAPEGRRVMADHSSMASLAPAQFVPEDRDFAANLARDPSTFLESVAAAKSAHRFAEVVAALDGAAPKLLERREVAALVKIAAALDVVAMEPGTRGSLATSALKPLSDPQMLGPIAELALTGSESDSALAAKLVVRAGVGGAYALYSARVKNPSQTARARIRSIFPAIGVAALPVIRSALERIAQSSDSYGAVELATDILASVPRANDELLGNVVSRYARAADPQVAAAATSALPKLWGDRSRALLVALLQHPGEQARLAAVTALLDLGAVDEHVVRKIAAVADDPQWSTPEIRAVATRALMGAQPEARSAAAAALVNAMSMWPDGPELVDVGRALISLYGDRAVPLLRRRAEASAPDLRYEIEALVQQP
jgi:serine/threonine-protein kinase